MMLLCCEYDDLIASTDNCDYQGTRFVFRVYLLNN